MKGLMLIVLALFTLFNWTLFSLCRNKMGKHIDKFMIGWSYVGVIFLVVMVINEVGIFR